MLRPTPRSTRALRPEDLDRPHPIYCVWEITLACDLGCKHCGSRAGKARTEELTTEECLDVVAQLHETGVREVTLIGGEAYLREDWDLIARALSEHGMEVGITTGARNLTEERVKRAVDAGVRKIGISIDGLERTHDAQRGVPGSFRAALEGAQRVSRAGLVLATNTQINRLSMPELPALAGMLHDIGSRAWQVQLTVPMGRGADRPSLLLQPYELLVLFPLLTWIKEERLDPNGIRFSPGNNIGYFGPYEAALRIGADRGVHWEGCSAGQWSLGLEADGTIKGCPSLPTETYAGGNVRGTRIQDAVKNAERITFIKKRTREDLWGFCRDCYYADVCKAGCTWTSHVLMGKPGNNPYCIHRALEHEREGLRERLVHVEPAPGLPFDHGRFELKIERADGTDLAVPSLAGIPIDIATKHDWRDGSIWDEPTLRSVLAPEVRKATRPRLAVVL
jgi:radical SAM protein with 4Fe4S-binding SPASM domain